jgi:hypothetical protein
VITETVTASYAVTTAPTATAPGVGTYTAAFTGEFFTTQTKDVELPAVTPAEPIYDSALKLRSTVTADIQMRVNFYVNEDVVENYSKFWIEVTMAGETLRYELEGENALTYVADRERYYAYYYGVNATQMAETVSAVLYVEDANGQVYYGDTASTCVRDILVTTLMTSTMEEQCRMAADMLVYGGEAQRYFGSNQAPVDVDLTEEQMAKLNTYRTNTDPELTQDNSTESDDSGVKLGMTVSLQSCVELRLTVRSLSTDKPVQIVVKDHGTHEIVDVLDASFNGTSYKATYTGIGASGAHTQFEFRARTVDGEDSYTEIGQTQIWSLEGLAKGKKDSTNEQDQKLYTLAMAVLKYSDSVGVYLAALEQ